MSAFAKRLTSLFLSLICVLGCFAACAEGGNTENGTQTAADTSAAGTEAETYDRAHTPDNLPDDLDFGGAALRIAHSDGNWQKQEINPENDGSDSINEVILERNVIVAEQLHVNYEFTDLGLTEEIAAALSRSITSGSDDYDVVMEYQWKLLPQTLQHLYVDLWDIEYVDLEQPWWWTDYINELKVGNSTYYALIGDLSLTGIKYISNVFFNKNLAQKYNIDPESVYQMVMDGSWTYEQYTAWISMGYVDLNGDGKRDLDDRYGIMMTPVWETDDMTYNTGNTMYYRDEDGYPVLDVETEHFIEVMEYMVELFYRNEGVFTQAGIPHDQLFADGKMLFHVASLGSTDYLRDMTDEYGIVPYPKWDVKQEAYGALVHDAATLFAIPTTVRNTDLSAAALEALNAQSYRTLVPAYYEVALKYKYAKDSASVIVIDMLKQAASTNFAYAYNYALNNAGLLCRTMIAGKNANVASEWKKVKKTAERQLSKIIENYVGG